MATRHFRSDEPDDQLQRGPAPTPRRVIRPHRTPPPTKPIDVADLPTERPTPEPQSLPIIPRLPTPASHPLRLEDMVTDRLPPRPPPELKPAARNRIRVKIKDRNPLHTVYTLHQHAFTLHFGFYEIEADIAVDGNVMLTIVDVGGQWREQPFYINHEILTQLTAADKDAAAYYGFADDDEEGAYYGFADDDEEGA